jgi:hypothetical protein
LRDVVEPGTFVVETEGDPISEAVRQDWRRVANLIQPHCRSFTARLPERFAAAFVMHRSVDINQ